VDFETRQNDFNMLAFEQCETNVYWRSAMYMDLLHECTFICVRTFSIIVPFLCPLTAIVLKYSTYSKPNSVPIVLDCLISRHSLFSNVRNRTHYFGKQNNSIHRRRNEQVCSVGASSQVGSQSFRLRTETNSDCDTSFFVRDTRRRTKGKV
jgi:hypothetical protein